MTKLVLATTSPYRRQAFKFLNIEFTAEASEVDEDFKGRPSDPKELVQELARRKAESVGKRHSEGIIVGFDSVGCFDDMILEKPKSREEAFLRLKRLSGNTHMFYTGIHVINIEDGKTLTKVITTKTFIRKLTDDEINKYLDQDPNFNTYALGYDPLEHYSATFVEKIEGSYNNLLRGFPLEAIIPMLKKLGYEF